MVTDFPIKAVLKDGYTLDRYLRARQMPAELADVDKKKCEIAERVASEMETKMINLGRINFNIFFHSFTSKLH